MITFMITGIITSIQFKQDKNRTDIITMKSLYEEQKNIDNENLEIERLGKTLVELEEKLKSYQSKEYGDEDIVSSLEEELEANKIAAGFKDLQGPGIRIHMKDSEQLGDAQDVMNFVIHNSDVLQIINDLRSGDAERIAINGSPVGWDSEIDCNGATIRVGNDIFAPPFIVEAIGDPQKLEGILNAPNSIVQLMKIWDIQIDIQQVDNITIRGINSTPTYKYLKKDEEGDKR